MVPASSVKEGHAGFVTIEEMEVGIGRGEAPPDEETGGVFAIAVDEVSQINDKFPAVGPGVADEADPTVRVPFEVYTGRGVFFAGEGIGLVLKKVRKFPDEPGRVLGEQSIFRVP